MRSLTGSLADGMVAHAILIPPRPPNWEGKGSARRVRKLKMLVST